MSTFAGPGWSIGADVRELFAYPFMQHAFAAGTIVAVTAGLVGWFLVLRRQTFAGHTLSVVGFPGASGAAWLGVGAAWGYYTFCIAAALLIAAAGRNGPEAARDEPAVTGTVQACALASGFLFVSLYSGNLGGVNALLFGNFLGITRTQVWTLLLGAVLVLAVLAIIGRPLLFASLDRAVAAAHGVRVRALGTGFLVLLGVAIAATSQVTGTLLVFALLVMPPATAHALTGRPVAGLALSVVVAVLVTWVGLAVAYWSPYPIGFFITTFAFAAYLLALAARWARTGRPVRHPLGAPA